MLKPIQSKKLALGLLALSLCCPALAATYQFRQAAVGVTPAANFEITGSPATTQAFNSAVVGSVATPDITFTLQNVGGTLGTFFVPALSGPNASDFSTATNCTNVPANGTCTLTVRFNPSGTGSRSSSLTLNSTTYSFTGTGTPNIITLQSYSGYKAWSDGTYATSCNEYLNPPSNSYQPGTLSDGIYRISVGGSPTNVYCDMTTDGGGWTLTFHGTSNLSATYDLPLNQSIMVGGTVSTYTSDNVSYPVLPSGRTNNYSQALFKGGNSTWTASMGGWVRFSMVANAGSVSTTLRGVLTGSGKTAAYLSGIGWAQATVLPTTYLILWDAAGISPICGGNNKGSGKNCPTFQYSQTNYAYHYDTASSREFYVR